MKRIVIIPIYRDSDNLLKVLTKFSDRVVDEIYIVADCVEKGGIDEIAEAATKIKIPINLVRNQKRKGIGYAIRSGIEYALKKGYDVAVVMAGNNKDDPQEISKLLWPILGDGCDYVQGSRFLPGGKRIKTPFLRGIFSRLYPFFWTLCTGVRCTDVTNGFRAYKLKIFLDKRINIGQQWLESYELEYYIHYKVLTLGYKIAEIPVTKAYSHRHKGGYSNISPFRDWWKIVGPLVYLKLGIRD